MKVILCAWIFFISTLPSRGSDLYWTPEAEKAYTLVYSLRVDECLTMVRLQSIAQPDNRIWTYLEDYAEFMRIFVQEDLRKIPEFMTASANRLDKLSEIPESNPLALMTQGQLLLHQCALHLQQGEFIQAATDINKAFKLLRKNQKLFPDDKGNLRLYASLKVAFGAVPDQYRWLISIVTSLSGTIEEGLGDLYGILSTSTPQNNIYFRETVLFTALAEGRLNNHPGKALQVLRTHVGTQPDSRLMQYLMANLLIANGQNDEAIKVLMVDIPAPGVVSVPFLHFMTGECKLFRGDQDADAHFKKFLAEHKGKHFIKEAHQKMAWDALLKGNRPGYFHHMQQILIKGSNTTDEDKQAMTEAETHATPHPILLRSRLYYDGGYYEKALEELKESVYNTLSQHAHRLEFLYRKGRILQARQSYPEALHYLSLAISSGQYERYYFACSAALQSGIIHETLGNKGLAAQYYRMCLDMMPETYGTSLHQKARIGLNRVGG